MAHVREKFALGPSGRFRGLFRPNNFGLSALAFRDILDTAFVIESTSLGIANDSRTLCNPDFGAVFTIDFIFETDDEAVFFQGLLKLIP